MRRRSDQTHHGGHQRYAQIFLDALLLRFAEAPAGKHRCDDGECHRTPGAKVVKATSVISLRAVERPVMLSEIMRVGDGKLQAALQSFKR